MKACEVWLSAEFLARNGHVVTSRPDGRVTATCGEITHLLGVCGHDTADCPPLPLAVERRAAA